MISELCRPTHNDFGTYTLEIGINNFAVILSFQL